MDAYVSVIGGINLDIKGVPTATLRSATSNPGSVYTSSGGVGRNIAHNLALLDIPVMLFGVVGGDAAGTQLLDELRHVGVNADYVRVVEAHQTGMYLSILNASHDLAVAISGMAITDALDAAYLESCASILQRSRFVVVETNVRTDVLKYIVALCAQFQIPCLIEPVSVEKSRKILDVPGSWHYMTPNADELGAISHYPIRRFDDLPIACSRLAEKCRHILVTLGKEGVYAYNCAARTGNHVLSKPTDVADSTGAGDAFVAGFISGVVRNCAEDLCIRMGIAAACFTVQSTHTVEPNLSYNHCISLAMDEEESKK